MEINNMKRLVTIFLMLMFFGIANAQETIQIDVKDWKYMHDTFYMMDSSLTNCQNLNILYEKRIDEYIIEVGNLRLAGTKALSIIKDKDEQLKKRKEQVAILNRELEKKQLENWIYRGAGTAIIIVGAALLLLK